MTTGRADNNKEANHLSGRNVHISDPDDVRNELLPGVPNDIALQVIAPKLSATDLNTLSLVSPTWREAVRIYGRRVYGARGHSKENFALVISMGSWEKPMDKLRLYPLNGNSAYDLPPIPFYFHDILGYKCIPLDGKIYIFGGAITPSSPFVISCYGSRMMFMLDVAGHKQWKHCSRMQEGRQHVSAGVLDGKIYVVGGLHNGKPVGKCEVYDPKVDAWSSIAELVPLGYNYRVGAIGGELFVYGGYEWSEDLRHRPLLDYVAVYNPVRNEWRQIGHFQGNRHNSPWVRAFIAQGKFHTFTEDGIDVYDMDNNSWSNLHSVQKKMSALWTFALGDEIVTQKYDIPSIHVRPSERIAEFPLVQSRGFGKNIEIAFEPLGNSRLRRDLDPLRLQNWDDHMYLIQL